jgi:hypothetical protein
MKCAMLVFLLVVGLCLPTFAQEEDSHHCHDPEAWTEWQGRGNTPLEDQELQVLPALWMGLCSKVEAGDLALDDTISLFENARHTLIQRRQSDVRKRTEPRRKLLRCKVRTVRRSRQARGRTREG